MTVAAVYEIAARPRAPRSVLGALGSRWLRGSPRNYRRHQKNPHKTTEAVASAALGRGFYDFIVCTEVWRLQPCTAPRVAACRF